MSAIIFPPSPALYDVFSSGSRQWQWDGSVWNAVVSTSAYVGTGAIYSTTAPLSPTNGMRWVDTNTLLTYTYYGSAWVEVENVGLTLLPPISASNVLGTFNASQMPTGTVLQTLQTSNAAYTTTALIIAGTSDILPSITDGIQILSLSITPTTSANKVLVNFSGSGWNSTSGGGCVFALFRGNVCIAGQHACVYTVGSENMSICILDAPTTTSAVTYSVRFGQNAGYAYSAINGAGSRNLGGVQQQIITLQEIKG